MVFQIVLVRTICQICYCSPFVPTVDVTIVSMNILQGYKVYYTLSPDLPTPLWTVHRVEGSQLTNILNLLTNRTYTLKVLAFTAVGDGPLSEHIQVKMQQGGTVRCPVSIWPIASAFGPLALL